MIRSGGNILTNGQGRELREHGTSVFPAALYDSDWSWESPVDWHWHDELEAALIVEGEALVATGSMRERLQPGDGFFINAGGLHGVWPAGVGQCGLHTRTIVFHPRLIGGSIDSIFWQKYVSPFITNPAATMIPLFHSLEWGKEAIMCIERAWDAGTSETYGYEFQMRTDLSQLVLLMFNHFHSPASFLSEKALRNNERIKTMLQYVHSHYAEELSTSQISQAASVSERECLRCFKNMIGTTPMQYVKQYRIQAAMKLLSSTEQKISDIGVTCGFQDMSYFAKTFREIWGCTPSDYRKRTEM